MIPPDMREHEHTVPEIRRQHDRDLAAQAELHAQELLRVRQEYEQAGRASFAAGGSVPVSGPFPLVGARSSVVSGLNQPSTGTAAPGAAGLSHDPSGRILDELTVEALEERLRATLQEKQMTDNVWRRLCNSMLLCRPISDRRFRLLQ